MASEPPVEEELKLWVLCVRFVGCLLLLFRYPEYPEQREK